MELPRSKYREVMRQSPNLWFISSHFLFVGKFRNFLANLALMTIVIATLSGFLIVNLVVERKWISCNNFDTLRFSHSVFMSNGIQWPWNCASSDRRSGSRDSTERLFTEFDGLNSGILFWRRGLFFANKILQILSIVQTTSRCSLFRMSSVRWKIRSSLSLDRSLRWKEKLFFLCLLHGSCCSTQYCYVGHWSLVYRKSSSGTWYVVY